MPDEQAGMMCGEEKERFSIVYYLRTLFSLLGAPGGFFSRLPPSPGYGRPAGFLVVSGLFSACAGMLCVRGGSLFFFAVFLTNALFMPVLSAGVGFLVASLFAGRRIPFERVFAVFAFSSGTTLIASWIPFSLWLTEPWKWILIALGMAKGEEGLGWGRTIIILGATILLIILFFRSVFPLISWCKGQAG